MASPSLPSRPAQSKDAPAKPASPSRPEKAQVTSELARKRSVELAGRSAIEFKKSKTSENDAPNNKELKNGRCTNVSDGYEKLGRIGEGTYGIVYKARDKKSHQLVALKRCLPHHQSSDGFPLTTLREIGTLKTLHCHPNIVSLLDVAVSTNGVFLVFEYAQHDLAQLVDAHYSAHGKSPFSEEEVKRLMLQLLSALQFLHSRHFLHRDIKLSNLLYNSSGELKLADFGLSRKFSSGETKKEDLLPLTGKVVSLWYRPPELLLGSSIYNQGVDNWGAGCVLGELLTGKPLLNGKTEEEQIQKVFELLGPPTLHDWPVLKSMPLIQNGTVELPRNPLPHLPKAGKSLLDRFSHLSSSGLTLLQSLLSYDYTKRCTASRALESKYFKETPLAVATRHMPRFPPKHGV